jgi:hypothetical protein
MKSKTKRPNGIKKAANILSMLRSRKVSQPALDNLTTLATKQQSIRNEIDEQETEIFDFLVKLADLCDITIIQLEDKELEIRNKELVCGDSRGYVSVTTLIMNEKLSFEKVCTALISYIKEKIAADDARITDRFHGLQNIKDEIRNLSKKATA